jgi:ATP-dependent Lon protease
VGGLPEKTVAAQRLGIEKVLLPKANEKDLPDLPEQVRKRMELVFVDHIDEALEQALVSMPGTKKGTRTPKRGQQRRRPTSPPPA